MICGTKSSMTMYLLEGLRIRTSCFYYSCCILSNLDNVSTIGGIKNKMVQLVA